MSAEPFIGEIIAFAGKYPPRGYLLCDGAEVRQGQFDALYAIIGNAFGGNGAQRYKLPDLRGRVPIMVEDVNQASSQIGVTGGSTERSTIDFPQGSGPVVEGVTGEASIDNLQPYLTVTYCIAYVGEFPEPENDKA